MQEQEIDLLELWDAIIGKWYLILLSMIIGGGIAFAFSTFVLPKLYESQTTMIVGKSEEAMKDQQNIQYNDVLTNQKLVTTYSEIMKSRSISERVINNLELDMDHDSLSKKLDISAVQNTEVISLTVTDTIPERARDIANETAEIFKDFIKTIMKVDNVQILDPAVTPDQPSSPNKIKNTALGALVGAFLIMVYLIIQVVNDQSIKSQDQIESNLELPVLGVVPVASKEELYDERK